MERKTDRFQNAETKKEMTETWIRKHELQFIGATRNRFIQAIRDGHATLESSSFKSWLGQEYWLVRKAMVPFLSTLLQKARHESDDTNDIQVIQTGMSFRNDEVSWLENKADKLHVSLTTLVPHQPTIAYSKLLESLTSPETEYTVAVSILWAIEHVYHHGFARCLGGDSHAPEEMKEVCRKWGDGGFGEYCRDLKRLADRRLEKGSNDVVVKAEVVLLKFLEIGVEFWNVNMMTTMQPNAA